MKSFADLNLSPELMKSIEDLKYQAPTPIQAETLPILLGEPTDFLGLAATGTGKTAAFSIPMIEKLDVNVKAVQALILCPTRELALQVAEQISLLGKHKRVKTVSVYGGASYRDQINGLRSGAHVVVGTPGRVVDHLERGILDLSQMKTLILDEADEMISMGFKDDLEKVLQAAPKEQSKIWLFSATMDKQVSRVANDYLKDPRQVQVNRKEMLSSTIEQFYYPVRESDKAEILCKLIESAEDFYGLIFCQTKQLVTDLTTYLIERGYKVDCLHGDKDQNSRERTMQAFRERRVKILVCTDVASRGLDVKDITHVINYSLPREMENYVHRIGRTARSGKTGIAMNLVTPSHRRLMFQIENMTKTRMTEGKIPTRKEIGSKKISKVLPNFTEQSFFYRAQEILGDDWKTALAGMSTEEVAARFLAMMMPDLFNERDKQAVASFERKEERAPRQGGRRDFSHRGNRGESRGDNQRSDSRPFRKRNDRDSGGESREFRKSNDERGFRPRRDDGEYRKSDEGSSKQRYNRSGRKPAGRSFDKSPSQEGTRIRDRFGSKERRPRP